MRWHDMDGASWAWMSLTMIFFWSLALAGLVLLVRSTSHDRDRRPSAYEVLDERFARGELSEDEYEQRRAVLQRTASERKRTK
jgi:putative membrane protein